MTTNDQNGEKVQKGILITVGFFFLCLVAIFATVALTSCSSLPMIADDIEQVSTDGIVDLSISKGALKKQTDLHVNIDILNQEISDEK